MLWGLWSSLPLVAKVPIVALAVAAGLAGAGWGAVAAWTSVQGVASVRVENVNCGPLEPPPGIVRTVTALVPNVSVPGSPIGSGQSGVFSVPAGEYEVSLTEKSVKGRWRFVSVEGTFTGRLVSAEFDGRELLGQGEVTLNLEKGQSYLLRLQCG